MKKRPAFKPGYSLTRRAFWISFYLSWLVISFLIVGALFGVEQAANIAGVAIPSMVGLIAALLGIHRFTGSLDMRASLFEKTDITGGET